MDATNPSLRLHLGDALDLSLKLEPESVNCIVTSPPYFRLREYGIAGELGQEQRPEHYVNALANVLGTLYSKLTLDGTLFLNLGDSYAGGGRGPGGSAKQRSNGGSSVEPMPTIPGIAAKNLIGIPWLTAFELRRRGWYLRSEIIWDKPNAMPESVRDRPTRSHEHVFLLTRSANYYWDYEAGLEPYQPSTFVRMQYPRVNQQGDQVRMQGDYTVAERERGMRNVRSVWRHTLEKTNYEHTATMPERLVERCLKLGCPAQGVVLDPFCGTGTTLAVARDLGYKAIGFDIDPACIEQTKRRLGRWTARRLQRAQLEFELDGPVLEERNDDEDRRHPDRSLSFDEPRSLLDERDSSIGAEDPDPPWADGQAVASASS